MQFMEIEAGLWIAPELVTTVRGMEGGYFHDHWVELVMLGGSIVRCREHSGPDLYAPDRRPDCYLHVATHGDTITGWSRGAALELAEGHANEVQAQIALYRTPIELRPLPSR